MNKKKFWLIVFFLLIATTLPTCKRKESSHSQGALSSALHEAASNRKRTADVEKLLANGADVDSRNKEGMTPLHVVAFLGHIRTARLLTSHGANVNALDSKGETPLHLAADGGWPEIAKLLLDAGSDANAKTKEGNAPLDFANRNISLCEQMLQARPVEGPGKPIAKLALDQVPALLERYKACSQVLQDYGAK